MSNDSTENPTTTNPDGSIGTPVEVKKEPPSPATPDPTLPSTPREISKATTETTEFEATIASLPEDQKIIALLGIKREVDIIQIPEPFCAITIKINRSNLNTVREALKPFALPCSSDFIGETSDGTITLTYIAANWNSLDQIHQLTRKINPSSAIYVSEARTLAVKIPKSRLISLDPQTQHPNTLTAAKASGEKQSPPPFETAHATPASLEAAQKDKETGVNLPQTGHCTYLMIDQTFLQAPNPKDPNLQKLMDEIELVRKSDHFRITAYNGYIVMIGTSERSGSSLTAMAQRFYRTIPRTCVYLGTGDVATTDNDKFSIAGFPTDIDQAGWKSATPPGVHLTDEFHKLITDPTKRDSALCSIEARPQQSLNLHKLVDFRPKASARIGGPDRFIGKERELQEAEDTLTDRKNKLTIIKGPAGIGKSRLIDEVLKRLPGAIYCSVDPFGKESKAPGYGLMTMTEQIADKFKDEPNNSQVHKHPHTKAIMDFIRKSQKEKLDACTETPEEVTDICFNALSLLNKGNSVFVLDDLHHADSASVRHLTHLAYKYMTEAGGKAVIGMREEEIFEPEAVRDLGKSVEERFGKEAVKTISVTGLNFSDDKIAHDFAYHSFKPNERTGKVLGQWYRKLGKAAGGKPWIMKTLMDGILANPEENLEILGDTILLKQDAETLIDRILAEDYDLSTYYRRRVHSLSDNARTLLQCIALAGGQATAIHVIAIAKEAAGLSIDKIRTAREELVKGRHLVSDDEATVREEDKSWELQDPPIKNFVIESIENTSKRLLLAQKLHEIFSKDETTPTDTKLSIALQIAQDPNAPDLNDGFWQSFTHDVRASLEEAREMQTTGRAHQIATSAVTGEKAPQRILEAREALCQGQAETLPNHFLKNTIITALLDTAEAAVTLGRFEEALVCITELETIKEKNADLEIDMARAYSILFQKAYLERNKTQMKEALEKLEKTGKAKLVHLAVAKIKLAFREHKWDDVQQIYQDNTGALEADNTTHKREHKNAPSPDYIEILRLVHCRSEFEKLRSEILPNLDEDVELQAGLISQENAARLGEMQRFLNQLIEEKKQHPRSFTPHCEIPLLEQTGIIHAYLGNSTKALEALGEAWRICNQVEFHEQEARIAKLTIDVLAMTAVSTTIQYPTQTENGRTIKRTAIDPKPLFKALKVRKEQAMVPLAHIKDENNFYHLGIPADSIRIVGLIACAFENAVGQVATDPEKALQKAQFREGLEEAISTAFEDFIKVNRISKAQERTPYHKDAGTVNAVSPYMGHIIELAQKLEIPVPEQILNPEESPFMDRESLREGFAFGKDLNDTGLGEIEKKQSGYKKLATILSYA